MRNLIKIPKGWRELRAYSKIKPDDKIQVFNGPRFVRCDSLNCSVVNQRYIKNGVGAHWLIIRKNKS